MDLIVSVPDFTYLLYWLYRITQDAVSCTQLQQAKYFSYNPPTPSTPCMLNCMSLH